MPLNMNEIHMRRFRNIPPLQYLLGFEAAARLESFSKAAEELGLSQSAISHEMRALEQRIGQALFIRQGRSIRLTDAGRDYQRSVLRGLDHLEAGYRRLEPFRKPSSVVIYAPHDFAARWLVPRLAHLRKNVPGCEPWIDTSGIAVDFNEVEVSIAIARLHEASASMISLPLFEDILVAVASPHLLKRPLKRPSEIINYPLIHDERAEGWREWFESTGVAYDEISAGLDFSSSDLALQAAENGLGIAMASLPLAQNLIADKKLVQVFPHCLSTGLTWFALSTAKELENLATNATWKWLQGQSEIYLKT